MLNSIKLDTSRGVSLLTRLRDIGHSWYWAPRKSVFQHSFVKLTLFTAVITAFISPNAAEAKASYPAAVFSSVYPGTKLATMCANCHSNWGGGDVRYNNGSAYWIFEGGTGTAPAAGSEFYTLDEDMDGSSTDAEYINSQSSSRPATAWQPNYPDKDGDGCIQLYYRSNEVGLPLQALNVTSFGYVGGFRGYTTYGPIGWDIDDNDPSQGCSTAWPTTASPGSFVNPGVTTDSSPPARIADFRAENLVAGQIPFAWTAVGDDGLTGTAHSYDLRYTTVALAAPKLLCGPSGTSACNVRLASDWEKMYDLPDSVVNMTSGKYIPKSGAVMTVPAGSGSNTGSVNPLMRAFYEPVPVAPGTTQQYILRSKGLVYPTNVISNGTTYWAAIKVSDGVLKVDHVETPTTGFTENVSPFSNIVAVTAGTAGAAITSYTNYYGLSPDNGVTYQITVNGVGLNATNAAQIVLVDSSGAVIDTGTSLARTGDTSITGSFICAKPVGTYTLEARTSGGVTKAAWVDAVSVTANLCSPAPTVTSATPNSRGQGAVNQNITIVGTEFVNGAVASFSGSGITVNSTTFVSSTSLTANINIAYGAATGIRNVTVTNPDMKSGTQSGGFTVLAGPTMDATTFPDGMVSVAYSKSMSATGGATPYTWSATGLPSGLSINSSSGLISGTPAAIGTYGFTVRVADANGGGNSVGFSMVVLPNGPRVLDVSSTLANGSYTIGQVVPITVTFSKVADVTGTPQLILATGSPATTTANYSSGSGTAVMTFNYVVSAGNTSADLDYTSTGALIFNGGTIRDSELNNATLTLPAPGASGSLGANKNIIIDTTAPTVNAVPLGGIYNSPQSVTLTASETATIYYTTNGSTPTTASTVYSGPIAVNANTTLKYFARDTATNDGAVVTQTYVIDMVAPTVTSVSSPLANGTYYVGQIVPVTVTFSEPVSVTGTPRLTLSTGTPATTAVNYSAGSGTATLSFYYTVVTGNTSADLDYSSTTALALNGGAIRDAALNNAVLTLAAPASAGSLGANKNIVISNATTSPRVTGVTSNVLDKAYTVVAGQLIDVRVTFTSAVTVTGTPQLMLATGAPASTAVNYSSGSGTTTLVFNYTVAAGNTSPDLDYTSFDALTLSGGTIVNAGVNATLTLPFPGAAGSLGANKAIVIDTTLPVVTAAPGGGSYNSTQSVVLSANESSTIFYTTNGTNPTLVSPTYTSPISISANTALKYFARDAANNNSAIATQNYIIDSFPPIVSATPSGGSYGGAQSVTLSANETASIYYTVDGSTPTIASTVYTAPISITTSTTLKFFGRDTAGNNSAVDTQEYVIDNIPPVITASPVGGNYNSTQSITLSSNEPATILYTLDGSAPTSENPSTSVYMGEITISESATLNYTGADASGNFSDVATQIYVIDRITPVVTASLLGGTYSGGQVTTLSISEPGSIYYTTDGTTPTIASPVYTSPIPINADMTLKYFAMDSANNLSPVATQIYIITIIDLVMTNVSSTSTNIGIGESFIIDSTEMNQGMTRTLSPINVTRFYLSLDATITSADILLTNTQAVGALVAGASLSYSTTVSVPKTVEPGTYYLGAIADATSKQTEVDETNNSLAGGTVNLIRDVDLIMTSVSTGATSVGAGNSFTINSTEKNQGSTVMTATTNTVKLYLSTDATITAADIWLTGGSRVVSALAGGASSTGSTVVTVPMATPPGTYYVGAIADATDTQIETNEANNDMGDGMITVIRDVDLVMTAVSTTATSVNAGTAFTITNTEANQGTTMMTVATNTIKFYLSLDNVITASDTVLTGTRIVSGLLAGGSSTGTTTVTVPKATPIGTYYIGAIADGTSAQIENNETNNAMAGGTITVVRNVDLVMSAVSTATTTASVGTTFTINNTETNQGTTAMTVTTNAVKFYLSTDSVITTSDIVLTGSRFVSALAAGASSTATTTITVPKATLPDTYYIGACADASLQQVETNEGNNCLAAAGTVVITRDVDLVMSAISTTVTSVNIGETFPLANTETNQGTTAMTVATNSVKFYLSLDNMITTGDVAVGSRVVSALAAGASNTATTTVTVPKATAPGTYYIGAIADVTNGQIETDESNNMLAGTTITVVRDVDLVISAVSTTETTVARGATFAITSTETNQGTTWMSATTNTIKFYLSTDPTITSSDIALTGSRFVSSLAAGASSTGSANVKVSLTMPTGTYYIGAIADTSNAQPESNEGNNTNSPSTVTIIVN